MEKINQHLLLFILMICSFIISCSKASDIDITMSIKVTGSTTVLPVVTKAAELFMKTHPDVIITVNSGGSGVGVASTAKGFADIGMISRNISRHEKESFSQVDLMVHMIGKDAVTCVVSSAVYNAGINSLSPETIRKIYLGEIVNWKQVGGPDKDIFVVDKELHRGTRHVFMEYIFGDVNAKTPGADIVTGSNNEMQSKIGQSNSAIGMLSYAWITKSVIGVGIELDGKVTEPTIENIKTGSYPIARILSLVTRGKPSGAISEFISFILSPEGQRIVMESGYVPI
jgi:phosphate transport system substrate-binding protein